MTQDLCAVCAVDVSVVDDALNHLGCTAEVLTIDPHTLDEVLGVDPDPGRARPVRLAAAETLVADLHDAGHRWSSSGCERRRTTGRH